MRRVAVTLGLAAAAGAVIGWLRRPVAWARPLTIDSAAPSGHTGALPGAYEEDS